MQTLSLHFVVSLMLPPNSSHVFHVFHISAYILYLSKQALNDGGTAFGETDRVLKRDILKTIVML